MSQTWINGAGGEYRPYKRRFALPVAWAHRLLIDFEFVLRGLSSVQQKQAFYLGTGGLKGRSPGTKYQPSRNTATIAMAMATTLVVAVFLLGPSGVLSLDSTPSDSVAF